MTTLIVHPQDPTTTFLSGIYKNLTNKTVVTGGITKDIMRKKIESHDRILMMGHGSPAGLFSVGQFPGEYSYIVDDSMAESLYNKDCILIWCYADHYINRHCLVGFNTNMFISEISEGLLFGFDDIYDLDVLIEESNFTFAEIVGRYINEPVDVLYQNVLHEYGRLAKANPIALFNYKRLYLSQPEPVLNFDQVGKVL